MMCILKEIPCLLPIKVRLKSFSFLFCFYVFSLERLRDSLEEMHSRDSLLTNQFYDIHERLTGLEEVQVKVSFYLFFFVL